MPVNSFENYPMSWKPVISDRKGAIYTQLAEQLVKDIRNGLLYKVFQHEAIKAIVSPKVIMP